MRKATRVLEIVAGLALASSTASAETLGLASPDLYKLRGAEAPVLGYKLRAAQGPNFLSCDGVKYTAKDSDLTKSAGSCGDSKIAVAVFSLTPLKNGDAKLHVFDSNAPELTGLIGKDAHISKAVLTSDGLGEFKTALDGKGQWITTHGAKIGELMH